METKKDDLFDLHILSNFIHQIINPLNGVIGTVDNLIDGTIKEGRRQQRLKAVRAQLEWVVVLVRNLAFFTKTALTPGDSPDSDLTRVCDMPKLIIEAAQFFQEVAESRNIVVRLTDEKTQYRLIGSPDLLRQVFMNLIDNAVKYGNPDTTVEITPRVQKSTQHLLIEVTNVGISFAADESEKLFAEGYRGSDAKKRVASGTGLGLYICKLIVEKVHKGRIEAEYSPTKSLATFRMRFPDWKLADV